MTIYVRFVNFVRCLLSTRLTPMFNPGLLHAVMGVASEAGELLNKFKKLFFYVGEILDYNGTLIEMSDILHFFQQLCEKMGTSLEELMEINIAKLEVRYPNGYDDNKAVTHKRNKRKEREAVDAVVQHYDEIASEEVLKLRRQFNVSEKEK